MAHHEPQNAPRRVPRGPKRSTRTAFVLESVWAPPGTDHKWVWHRFVQFLAALGLFWPIAIVLAQENQFGAFKVKWPPTRAYGEFGAQTGRV